MLAEAKKLLKKIYGYSSFRGGQAEIITSILEKRDTFAIMPTGGGKSICFQIPALLFAEITLVISPLISLMKDQVDTLNTLGIPATFINSSIRSREVNERIRRTAEGEYRLLYIAPERLESEAFLDLLKNLSVSLIAIDEAHCVSQWGHDFRTSYRRIGNLVQKLPSRPIMAAFTATATTEVKADILRLLGLDNPQVFISGFDRANLSFSVLRGANRREFILDYVGRNSGWPGIIYAATRKDVDQLYELLAKKGFAVGRYHAGMSDKERAQVQEAFIYDDLRVMVATNAFGMGIDKSNIRYVLHYNLPKNMESYYQEVGRAGRDGEPGECVLLYAPQDIPLQKYLIEQTSLNPKRQENEYRKLQIMTDYAHTSRCLRQFILEYFGEKTGANNCANCSSCNAPGEIVDVTVEAQKIFSCIARMHQQYGITLIAEVLKGSQNKKLLQFRLNGLPTYGIMQKSTLNEIKDFINLLIAENYLKLTAGKFPVVRLQPSAFMVLKNEAQVFRKLPQKKKIAAPQPELFEKLRQLRKELAQHEQVPPYIIFSDASLQEMAALVPQDETALLRIKGVGERKAEKYGQQFLQAIFDYQQESPAI